MIYFVTKQLNFQNEESLLQHNIQYISVEESLKQLNSLDIIGVDTETEGFDPYLKNVLLLQLGNKQKQFVIDCTTVNIKEYKSLLESEDKLFLLQNASFDLRFFYHKDIWIENVYDTMLAEHVLNTGKEYTSAALDSLTWKYCKAILDKGQRGGIHHKTLYDYNIIKYSADDVKYLPDILEAQLLQAKHHGLEETINLENEVVKAKAYMEYSGIKLDAAAWRNKMKIEEDKLEKVKVQLDEWLMSSEFKPLYEIPQLDLFQPNVEINWSSSDQVKKIFIAKNLDITVKDKKTGKMKQSIDKKVILKYYNSFDLIPIYIQYSEIMKDLSTYGKSYIDAINPVTGRIHGSYRQILNTGRMSCGGKAKTEVNLMNLPNNNATRHSFVAEEGNVLIASDYSSQESVVLADQSQEPALVHFYNHLKGDLHSYVASLIWTDYSYDEIIEAKHLKDEHKPLNDRQKHSLVLRQRAKAANFALA